MTMPVWYYADARNERQGPVAAAELVRLRLQGALGWDTLVWREGMGEWQPMRDFAGELAQVDDRGARMLSTGDGNVVAQDAATGMAASAAEPFSPYAPPASAIASHAAIVRGGEVVYAGFWKRVAANFIDSVVIGLVGGIIGAMIGGVLGAALGMNGGLGGGGFVAIQLITNLVSIVITAGYYAWFHSSTNRATLGKMAIGIKVVRSDGEAISFLRGVGRYFGFLLSSLILGIGLLMAAFTERKQALHDMLCDTLVVDKWAFTNHPEWQRRELGTVTIVVLALFGLLLVGMIVLVVAAIGLAASAGR